MDSKIDYNKEIYRTETEHAIIEIISPEIVLGRRQTDEEVQEILDEIAEVNYKIASRLYKEGKLATKKQQLYIEILDKEVINLNMNKTFYELTLGDCVELYTKKNWVLVYADGKFAGMRLERKQVLDNE